MEDKVLTICIPTYNRKLVLISDIKRYLSLNDNRFSVKVNDNCSSDGTIDELRKIADSRLSFNVNSINLGGLINGTLSLIGASSKYIIYLLDKDTIDTSVLSSFIDYLESNTPNFGFVDLSNKGERHIETYKAGKDAIIKVAYRSKHPSGFFWKTSLFEEEIKKDYIKIIDPNFEFLFDLMAGSLASKFDATIIYWPLIINANLRVTPIEEYKKSYTYNEANIYFGIQQVRRAFCYYLSNLMSLGILADDKRVIAKQLTDNFLLKASISLKKCYSNDELCAHYNMKPRKVRFKEMVCNSSNIICAYLNICRGHLPILKCVFTALCLWVKSLLRIIYDYIKCIICGSDTNSFSV